MRVLFVHGLEGHPNGTKVRVLREQGFDVHAADMHMSKWNLRRKNSVARQLLQMPEPWLAAGLGLVGLASSVRRRSAAGAFASAALSTGWLAVRRRALIGQAMTRSFRACVDVQRDALAAYRPDIVIGSSWGGAVVAELILEGSWAGPTILLAPAFQRVHVWMNAGDVSSASQRFRLRAEEVPTVIFHDRSDATVPYLDSVRLAAGSTIDLRTVDAGGHRLLELLERGELAQCLRELAEAG